MNGPATLTNWSWNNYKNTQPGLNSVGVCELQEASITVAGCKKQLRQKREERKREQEKRNETALKSTIMNGTEKQAKAGGKRL